MSGELKIGVFGMGAIGKSHIERICNRLRGGRVTAASDPAADFGKKTAAALDIPYFENVEDMIIAGDVDAVMVTTADVDHESAVLAALAGGKPVFCEKPLAPTAAACRRIVEAELATGRKLVQVGFMRRYDPGYRQLKATLDSGRYGAPLLVHCAHRNFMAPEHFVSSQAVTGTLIHEIDVLRWLLGEEYASVEMAIPKSTRHTTPIYKDPQMMVLTSASGVRIDVEAFTHTRVCYDIQCEICCEDGFLKLPSPSAVEILSDAMRQTAVYIDWAERFSEAYDIEIQDWIDATRAGRVDGPGAWDGLIACIVADAALASLESGGPVDIALPERPGFYAGAGE